MGNVIRVLPTIQASAKVIEPQICHTETWTMDYLIDNDPEQAYPYLECTADVYQDGTVIVYYYNTHDWEGFATFKHTVSCPDVIAPICDNEWVEPLRKTYSNYYTNLPIAVALKTTNGIVDAETAYYPITRVKENQGKTVTVNNKTIDLYREHAELDWTTWENCKLSYYNKSTYESEHIESTYTLYGTAKTFFYSDVPAESITTTTRDSSGNILINDTKLKYLIMPCGLSYVGALPELPANPSKDTADKFIFTPYKEITKPQEFMIFGHLFTVTPEMLSASLTANPANDDTANVNTDLVDVMTLKEQIRTLTAQLEQARADKEILNKKLSTLSDKNKLIEDELTAISKTRNHPADVNGDGVVNVSDIVMLKKILLSR